MREALFKFARRAACVAIDRSIDLVELALATLGVPSVVAISPPKNSGLAEDVG